MHPWISLPTWLRSVVVVLLVLGIFFRFANLDQKIYWHDETFTSLRISGYTEAEIVQQLSNRGVINPEALQKYQHPNPQRNLFDTLKSLAVEDTQHPPLYYAIAHFWVRWFGSSVTAIRSLSAVISLLAFPAIYWLCLELFESPLTAWVAVALMSISPLHIVFAQEARQYGLWSVTILLSSAALLRAMRLNTKGSWGIYAVTMAASLYTFLFSGLIAISHGIYVLILERFLPSKTLKSYLVAFLLGMTTFLPWIIVLITHLSQAQKTTAWAGNSMSLPSLIRGWFMNLDRIFIDWNYPYNDLNHPPFSKILFYLASLFLISLVGYSFYFLISKTSQRVWLFIFTLTGVTAAALVLPDLIADGLLSTVPRYPIACYLGIQLSVAHLVATKLSDISVKIWRQRLWQIVMVVLVSCGVLSNVISTQADFWWNKEFNQYHPEVARTINQANRPLLISDTLTGDLLSLSYLLNANVRLLIEPNCYTCHLNTQLWDELYLPEVPEGYRNVFLFHPRYSSQWRNQLEKQQPYKIEPLFVKESQSDAPNLWRLKKL